MKLQAEKVQEKKDLAQRELARNEQLKKDKEKAEADINDLVRQLDSALEQKNKGVETSTKKFSLLIAEALELALNDIKKQITPVLQKNHEQLIAKALE